MYKKKYITGTSKANSQINENKFKKSNIAYFWGVSRKTKGKISIVG